MSFSSYAIRQLGSTLLNWNNISTTPQRWAAKWLRKQGWVCFYLDPEHRHCTKMCWLELYQECETCNG